MTWYVWTYFDIKVKQTSHPDHRNMFFLQVQYNFPHIFLCPSYPFLLVTSGQGADQRTVFTSCRGPKSSIKNSKNQNTDRESERECDNLKGYPVAIHHRFLWVHLFPFAFFFFCLPRCYLCSTCFGQLHIIICASNDGTFVLPVPRCSVSGFFQLPFRSLFPDSRFPLPDLPSHLTWQLFNLIWIETETVCWVGNLLGNGSLCVLQYGIRVLHEVLPSWYTNSC